MTDIDTGVLKAYKQVIDYCSNTACGRCMFYDKKGYGCLIQQLPFLNIDNQQLLDLIKGVEENE